MSILENFNLDRFIFSLQYLWKGMLCIFIVIAVIILSIFLINFLTNRIGNGKKAKKDNSDSQNSAQ